MKNEALRIFLAMTALILTAMLTSPSGLFADQEPSKQTVAEAKVEAAKTKKITLEKEPKKKTEFIKIKHRLNRNFAFFYHR